MAAFPSFKHKPFHVHAHQIFLRLDVFTVALIHTYQIIMVEDEHPYNATGKKLQCSGLLMTHDSGILSHFPNRDIVSVEIIYNSGIPAHFKEQQKKPPTNYKTNLTSKCWILLQPSEIRELQSQN